MKKLLLTTFIFLFSLVTIMNVSAQDINGLEEQLNSLWVNDDIPMGQINTTYTDYVNKLINQNLSTPEYARVKANLPLNDTELIEYVKNTSKLNYSEILKVYPLITTKYMKQYAKSNSMRYLKYDKTYMSILKANGEYAETFDENGTYLNNLMSDYDICRKIASSVIDADGVSFLKNTNAISTMLSEKGETNVTEVLLLVADYEHTLLLIVCNNQEYIIQVYSGRFNKIDGDIEKYRLYTASEYVGKMTSNNLIKREKPTYSTEAESLQAEGLLKGNENGLDLLKPLTRIEAATMLLRAMGKDETADASQTQTFSDVPSEHWGFGAAENAYNLGLVKGVGDDKFAPDESVTAEQFATMVLRAGQEPEFNWEEAINIMIDKGIISQENASTMDFFTRGDMAKIIYEARANGLL